MNIKTKLYIIGLIFFSTVLIFGGSSFYLNRKSSQIEQYKKHVDLLIVDVFERNLVFHDYLLNQTERSKEQLLIRNKSIENHIPKLLDLITDEDDIADLNYIMDVNHLPITADIERLLTQDLTSDLRALIAANIYIKSQSTIQIAQKLGNKYSIQQEDFRELSFLTITIFAIIGLVSFLFVLHTITFINRSIKKLYDGAAAIAKGDMTYRIKASGRDEISVFAQQFNDMIEQLIISQSDINKSKQILEDRVRAQTEDLSKKIKLLEQFKSIAEEREHKMIDLKSRLRATKINDQS
jgi:methyl-accepting chemotaxis protein